MTPPVELVEAARTAADEMKEALERFGQATDDESRAKAQDEFDAAEAEHERVSQQIKMAEKAERASESVPSLPTPEPAPQSAALTVTRADVQVVSEPLTYGERQGQAGHSFIRDMIHAAPPGSDMPDPKAIERLQRHRIEMQTRDSTTTDTTSLGEMVPPLWMVERFAAIARAGRPLANALNPMPLPAGTENIIVPKVTTGGSVHYQTAQNTAIAEQDMVTGGTAQAVVKTLAGQIDTSLQSIEWSPVNMVDQFFLPELASLHANITETVVGTGNNTNGVWQGIIGTSGTQTVTYTSASPTAGSLYSKVADAIQQIHTNRFLPPNLIVMHPRRWAFLLAASDTTGRPLVVPAAHGRFNSMAIQDEVVSEGFVGEMQGLPVLVSSAAIPTNDATGTTNDVVLVMRREDLWFWESSPRSRVLYEVLSGALTVRIQLYNYNAFMADRYPKAISAIRGTGLGTPSF